MKAILAGHYSSQAICSTIKGKEYQGQSNVASTAFFDVKFLNEWISGDAYNFNKWNKVYSNTKLNKIQEEDPGNIADFLDA